MWLRAARLTRGTGVTTSYTYTYTEGGLAVRQGRLLSTGPREGSPCPVMLAKGELQTLLLVSWPLFSNTRPHVLHLSVLLEGA